nr:hypothetical protein [uncultured Sulfurimonas sp.]
MTIEELCEKIFEIEEECNLFEQKIQDVYFWKLVRFELYRTLLEGLDLVQIAYTKEFNSVINKVKVLYQKIKNTYLNGMISRKTNIDILIIESPRKVQVNNDYIDIYTHYKIKDIENDNTSYEIVDSPYLGKHYHKSSNNRSYFESVTFMYLYKKMFKPVQFKENEKKLLYRIEEKIKKIFSIELNLEEIVRKKLNTFKLKRDLYAKMLEKRSVKQVYLTCSYGKESLIAACNDIGVQCIELQHGVMNRYHLGYSFPNNKEIQYFPDRLEIFGKYWKDITPIPLKSNQIVVTGYQYLNENIKKYEKRDKNNILFLSQDTSGKKLSHLAYDFAKQNDEYKIIYKLHPIEFEKWKVEYPLLLKLKNEYNVEIIEDEINLYTLMNQASYVIGVNSTAIYESILFDCKIILIDLPGMREYMQPLIDLGVADTANNISNINNLIQNNSFLKIDKNYFFNNPY